MLSFVTSVSGRARAGRRARRASRVPCRPVCPRVNDAPIRSSASRTAIAFALSGGSSSSFEPDRALSALERSVRSRAPVRRRHRDDSRPPTRSIRPTQAARATRIVALESSRQNVTLPRARARAVDRSSAAKSRSRRLRRRDARAGSRCCQRWRKAAKRRELHRLDLLSEPRRARDGAPARACGASPSSGASTSRRKRPRTSFPFSSHSPIRFSDPCLRPAVARVDLAHRHGARERQPSRENLAARACWARARHSASRREWRLRRCARPAMTSHARGKHAPARVPRAYRPMDSVSTMRHSRPPPSVSNGIATARRRIQQLEHRIRRAQPSSASATRARSSSAREIAGAIEQHRQLVGRARPRPGAVPRRRASSSLERLERSPRRRPRCPSARRAARDRATAAPRAARRAACRRRTSSPSRIRTAATPRTATAARVSTERIAMRPARDARRARRAAPRMSNASCSTSRYVSTRIGNDGNSRTACSRSSALSRCSQSGMRRRGLPRGSSSARAAFMRKRAPNSDDAAHFLEHAPLRLRRRRARA